MLLRKIKQERGMGVLEVEVGWGIVNCERGGLLKKLSFLHTHPKAVRGQIAEFGRRAFQAEGTAGGSMPELFRTACRSSEK